MQIVPSINGVNLSQCANVSKILRGFVSVLNVRVSSDNNHLSELIKCFDKQMYEIELIIQGENYDEKLIQIVNSHSDVNIGKVFFYTKNSETVEQSITNIRIFGIQPGLIIDKDNFNIENVVNKFEYAVIDAEHNVNYMEMYKKVKENLYKGNLLLYFGALKIETEILTNPELDGVYVDITHNPRIKDTISFYRRSANSIY